MVLGVSSVGWDKLSNYPVRNFIATINIVRAYAQFPPVRFRDSRKNVMIMKNVEEPYGRTASFYSMGLMDIVRQQELVKIEVGRTEFEVLKDLKLASGLYWTFGFLVR